MNEVLDEPDEYELDPKIHAGNLLLSILFKPRETFRFIFLKMPEKHFWLLLILGGITQVMSQVAVREDLFGLNILGMLSFALVVGAAIGSAFLLAYALGMLLVGKLFGGQATFSELRVVVALSVVPRIPVLILDAGLLVVLQLGLVDPNESFGTPIGSLLVALSLFELALGIWSIVIQVAGIKLVQQFYTGMAIVNIILPIIILVVLVVGTSALLRFP